MRLEQEEIQMDTPCQACARGPSGSAGHGDLMMQALGDALTLRCVRCQQFWVRTCAAGGGFAWATVTEREARSPKAGIVVPVHASSPGFAGSIISFPPR
jgi:hypothetical protein